MIDMMLDLIKLNTLYPKIQIICFSATATNKTRIDIRKQLKLTNVKIFGPSKKGAQLEGSKDFSKNFMFRNNIPCGKSKTFNKKTINKAFKFLETMKAPYVLKADGLAAGKGVIISENRTKMSSF